MAIRVAILPAARYISRRNGQPPFLPGKQRNIPLILPAYLAGVLMPSNNDDLLDGITALTPPLVNTLLAFEQMQVRMHPGRAELLAGFIAPFEQALKSAFTGFDALTFPAHLAPFGQHLNEAATYALRACDGVTGQGGDGMAWMKAMRAQCRAQEQLYPVAPVLKPVSKYFLEQEVQDNEALIEALQQDREGQEVGILNFDNERNVRGGFTLYVPEYLKAHRSKPAGSSRNKPRQVPLVIVLHGGTGHGADFLWAWLREARSRGFLLLSPTSRGDTWSLMGEEHDLDRLLQLVDLVSSRFHVDPEHILLTGMSDGATYSLLAGLREASPFSHLASFSGVLHPEISMSGRLQHARGRNIYLVHGTLDWMFPIETAHMARAELEAAGANLTFRPIEGLSHTYARSENDALLSWFDPRLALT